MPPGTKLGNLIISAEKTLKMIHAKKAIDKAAAPAKKSSFSNNQYGKFLAVVKSLQIEKNDSLRQVLLKPSYSTLKRRNSKMSSQTSESLLGKRLSS